MRKKGLLSATVSMVVPFHDVDLMAVVWHGHYLKYLEAARWELMERVGYGFAAMRDSGYLWPIIESHLRHIRPAHFGERLDVAASLVEWQSRLVIHYLVADSATRERVARARTVQVAVLRASNELQFVCPPEFLCRVESSLAAARA